MTTLLHDLEMYDEMDNEIDLHRKLPLVSRVEHYLLENNVLKVISGNFFSL